MASHMPMAPAWTRSPTVPLPSVLSAVGLSLLLGCDAQTLRPAHLDSFARFGRDVAVEGSYAVIGAYQETPGGGQQGAAYLSRRVGGAWSIYQRLSSPAPAYEQFGENVALHGEVAAVAAPRTHQPGAVNAGSVHLYNAYTGAYLDTVGAPAPQAWEAFGSSLDLSASGLAVGAVDTDDMGHTDAGSVQLFERAGNSWVHAQTLYSPAPSAQAKFGSAVALSEDVLVVGALRADVRIPAGRYSLWVADAGAVYIFRRVRGAFMHTQTLRSGAITVDGRFGASAALSDEGNRLVVGAPGEASGQGRAYVFEDQGVGFVLSQTLDPSDGSAGDHFGTDLDLLEDRVLVGASGVAGATVGTGAAYVFDGPSPWTETGKLERADADAHSHFGGAVALGPDTALVGGANEDVSVGISNTGAVQAFRSTGPGVWIESHLLTAARPDASSSYGQHAVSEGGVLVTCGQTQTDIFERDLDGWSLVRTLSRTGNYQITSCTTDGTRVAFWEGYAHPTQFEAHLRIYEKSGSDWVLEAELFPDVASNVAQTESVFSRSMDLDGDFLVVGNNRYHGGDGRVYVYSRTTGSWNLLQQIDAPDAGVSFDFNFGQSVALSGDVFVVGEDPSSVSPNPALMNGRAFVYRRVANLFVHDQTLEAAVPAALDGYAASVDLSGDLLALGDEDGGAVRVFREVSGTFTEVWTSTQAMGAGGFMRDALSLEGDRLLVGRPSAAVESSPSSGEIMVFDRQPGDTFFLTATAVSKRPETSLWLGRAVDMDTVHGQVIGGASGRVVVLDL